MKIYPSQFINGVVCDVVLASDAEELEKRLAAKDNEITRLICEIKSLQGALRDSLADKDVEFDYD
jgi:chaperonin cofactor prefoldin